MSRQKISLNTLSGPDSRDLSVRYPADRIRVSAWFCQNLSEVPACYLGITRGRVRPFYLLVLSLYGFTTLYTNPFLIIYLLPHFKLPVLVLFWGLKQKKTKFGFPHPMKRHAVREKHARTADLLEKCQLRRPPPRPALPSDYSLPFLLRALHRSPPFHSEGPIVRTFTQVHAH
jgi:hypothetical protein